MSSSCCTGHHAALPALALQELPMLEAMQHLNRTPLLCRRHHRHERWPEPAWRQDRRCCRAGQPDSHLELHVRPPIRISLTGVVTAAGPDQQPPGTRSRPQDAADLRCAALSGAACWCWTRNTTRPYREEHMQHTAGWLQLRDPGGLSQGLICSMIALFVVLLMPSDLISTEHCQLTCSACRERCAGAAQRPAGQHRTGGGPEQRQRRAQHSHLHLWTRLHRLRLCQWPGLGSTQHRASEAFS